jgi:hypothetical protein
MDGWDGALTLFMSRHIIRKLGSFVVLNSLRRLLRSCSKGGIEWVSPRSVTVAGLNLAEDDRARLRM